MFETLLFVLASVGMTSIITEGKIAHDLREWVEEKKPVLRLPKFIKSLFKIKDIEWNEVIKCNQCCGFWCGLICGILIVIPGSYVLFINKIILCAFAGSFASMLGMSYLDYVMSLTYIDDFDQPDEDQKLEEEVINLEEENE